MVSETDVRRHTTLDLYVAIAGHDSGPCPRTSTTYGVSPEQHRCRSIAELLPAEIPNVTNHAERLVGGGAVAKRRNADGVWSGEYFDLVDLLAGVQGDVANFSGFY